MLCTNELKKLLERRLHISEGPSLADPKSARLSAQGGRPYSLDSPSWVEDVVSRRKAELEEMDCFKAEDKQACLLQHFKDKLALESVHVRELSQKLEEQQLSREMDVAHALTQRDFLQGEYQEYGAHKQGLAELEIEFREEYAIYQARSHSLKEWQGEFSAECADFRARNRGLMESQGQLQDECRAYGAHCCNLVEMQDNLRTELDEYRVRNHSMATWQGRFEQECEQFGARNRDLREWQTKFAEESEECAALNQDLARKQASFTEECAEFKTRNRSLSEWQSRFTNEYTEYKTLNRSLAKQQEKLQESMSQEQDSKMQQDADNQGSSAEGLLRHALAGNSVPLQDVRTAIGRMEALLQESKLEMAARALSEKQEAAQEASIAGHAEGRGDTALMNSAQGGEKAMPASTDGKEPFQLDEQGCLEAAPEKCIQGEAAGCNSSGPNVPEDQDQEHCKDPDSVASSANTSMEATETHLPDFEMLTPIAPPISKCADACIAAKLGMPPPSLTMEAAALSFPTGAAVLPGTPRMIITREAAPQHTQ